MAQSAGQGFEYVGMPEGQFPLAECCLYLPNEMQQGTYFYDPSEQGYEKAVAEHLEQWRERDFDADVVKRAQKYAEEDES